MERSLVWTLLWRGHLYGHSCWFRLEITLRFYSLSHESSLRLRGVLVIVGGEVEDPSEGLVVAGRRLGRGELRRRAGHGGRDPVLHEL